ncbi:MAG: hypothetical protein IJT09_02835, partial [Abditibacteriota bacterium]|nr:hypothetical protein [Abditibacteriota bacterium]
MRKVYAILAIMFLLTASTLLVTKAYTDPDTAFGTPETNTEKTAPKDSEFVYGIIYLDFNGNVCFVDPDNPDEKKIIAENIVPDVSEPFYEGISVLNGIPVFTYDDYDDDPEDNYSEQRFHVCDFLKNTNKIIRNRVIKIES